MILWGLEDGIDEEDGGLGVENDGNTVPFLIIKFIGKQSRR